MRSSRRRVGAATTAGLAVGLLTVGLLAACSPAATDPTAPPTTTAAATPTPMPSEDVEAQVLDAYYGYWDAVVKVFSGDVDRDVFEGVATGEIVEKQINEGRYIVENDLQYEGEPTFTDVTVEVDGDTANVAACVDSSTWFPPRFDPEGEDMVNEGASKLELIDGEWLVTDTGEVPAGLAC